MLPWVVYWHHQEPLAIKMNYSEFLKLFRISWESHIISLKAGKESIDVLVHEVQREPVSWDYIHIDFYAITKWETLTTKISLNFTGQSPAVREWALLNENLKEIEVKCLPKDLVDSFEVSLDWLKETWDSIKVSELNIGEQFEILTSPDTVVVAAAKPAKEEVIEDEAPVAEGEEAEEKAKEENKED